MPRLRTTLPKDFRPYGDPDYTVAELEQVFAKVDVNARGGYAKGPAIAQVSIDVEGVRWLLDRGAEVDALDERGDTPLTRRAGRARAADVVRLLLERGADPTHTSRSSSPVLAASMYLNTEVVVLLVEAGADPLAKVGYRDQTPLDVAMTRMKGHDVRRGLELARYLVSRGATVSGETPKYLRSTMSDVQRRVASGTGGERAEQDLAGMAELLDLLGVEPPVPPRVLEPDEPITVTAEGWKQQYNELWKMLVPMGGAADSVQGEVVRIAGRVGHEILGNGGGNWDRDFDAMLTSYAAHVRTGVALDADDLVSVDHAVAQLAGGGFDEWSVDALTELSVRWVLLNPVRVDLPAPPYGR